MKRYKKNRSLSKTILLFTTSMLLINATHISYVMAQEDTPWLKRAFGAIKETFSEQFIDKLKGLVNKSKAQIRKNVASTYQKIKNFDKATIIPKLRSSVEKLGKQVGEIKDCMLFGFSEKEGGCSTAKRAAFYATAITVLALTAAVVGFTITTAATSKEPDEELAKSIEQTSQEVKGWKPEAVFQRLSNKIESFKGNLLSMQECLTKRQCTKTQKRMLYATAGTITALVTITIGVGVGSYIYAQKKKAAELPVAEEDTKFADLGEFEDDPTPPSKWASLSPFEKLFRKNIDVSKGKAQTLRQAYNTTAQNLKDTYSKIKDAVKEGILTKQSDIIEAIKKAKAAATNNFLEFVEKTKDFAGLLQETLNVNIDNLTNAFKEAKTKLDKLAQSIKATNNLTFGLGTFAAQSSDLIKYVGGITDVVELISPLEPPPGYSALGKLASVKAKTLPYLENMLRVRTEEWKAGKITKDRVTEIENDIRIFHFIQLSNLKTIYPTLVQKIKHLELYRVGDVAKQMTTGLKALIDSASLIHEQAGKIGLIISQKNIQDSLKTLSQRIELLGQNIQTAFSNHPIIVTDRLGNIKIAKALVRAASSSGFKFLRKNRKMIKSVKTKMKELTTVKDALKIKIWRFKEFMSKIRHETREKFIAAIKRNPIKAIPNAARILRNSLEEAVKKAKTSFEELMENGANLLTKIEDVAPDAFKTLQQLNMYLEKVSQKAFINTKFLDGLEPIVEDIKELIHPAKKLEKEMKEIPTV